MERLLTKRIIALELIVAGIASALVVGLWDRDAFRGQELRLLDHRFLARPRLAPADDIVIVAIDDASLAHVGRWPWPRSVHAELIDRLTEAGAKVIALDVVFAEPGDPEEDRALADAIARSDRVVLPVFAPPERAGKAGTTTQVLYPLEELTKGALGQGHIGLVPDPDGRFRRVSPFVQDPLEGTPIPAFSLVAVCEYLGVPVPDTAEALRAPTAAGGEGGPLPLDAAGNLLSNFFTDQSGNGFEQVQCVAVLRGGVSADTFRDKLVFVGATAGGIGEQFFNAPVSPRLPIPGVKIHANAAETLLRGAAIRQPNPTGYGLVLFVLAFGAALGMIRLRAYDATYSVVGVALFMGALWGITQWRFESAHVWVDFYPFVVVAAGTLLFQLSWRLADALRLALRRREELDLVTEVGARASSTSALHDDFRAALDSALTVSDTNVGALWVLEETEEAFLLELTSGLQANEVAEHRVVPGEGTMGSLTDCTEPTVVADTRRAGDLSPPLPARFRSVVFVPLLSQSRCLGLLCVAKLKPLGFDEDAIQSLRAIANQSGLGLDNARLVQRLQRMFVATLGALITALEKKDAYTGGHSERVTQFAVMVGKQLGLPEEELEILTMAGEVHDIGKIGMPDIVLNKPGKLTDEEYEAFKSHAQYTGDILEGLDWLREVRDIAMHHHERWDGRGYPDGLTGEDCPLGARILAVTDAYDAMTSTRPYRTGMPQAKALGILVEVAGTQLDPKLVDAFLHVPGAPWTEAAQAILRERDGGSAATDSDEK